VLKPPGHRATGAGDRPDQAAPPGRAPAV